VFDASSQGFVKALQCVPPVSGTTCDQRAVQIFVNVMEAGGRQALICEPGDVAGLAKLLEQAAQMSEAEYAERAQRTREELAVELEPMEFYARAYRRILRGEQVEGVG
jgi:hypothetical protein